MTRAMKNDAPHLHDNDCNPAAGFFVQFDYETRQRLKRLCQICNDHPVSVIESIIRHVLKDDEDAHILDAAPEGRLN